MFKQLHEDNRGAVMVLGIVLGAAMVGALWYIAAIGDAALWRERTQDAADATAFEAAVWNARGMNVLVVLNWLMALVMSVLVIWRMIMMFLGFLIGATAAVCIGSIFFPALAGVCGFMVSAAPRVLQTMQTMARKDPSIARKVHEICQKLMVAEQAVATATPVLGTAQSLQVGAGFGADRTLGASLALVPTAVDNAQNYLPAVPMPVGPNLDPSCTRRMGTIVSLPVQDDSYYVVCGKAGRLWVDVVGTVVAQMSGALGGSDNVVESVYGTFSGAGNLFEEVTSGVPGLFCGDLDLGWMNGQFDGRLDDAIDGRCNANNANADVNEDFFDDEDGDGTRDWSEAGAQRCRDSVREVANRTNDVPGPQGINTNEPRRCTRDEDKIYTAKVWDFAKNSSLWMQAYAWASKEPLRLGRNDRGMQVADTTNSGEVYGFDEGSDMVALLPGMQAPRNIAQAEMYFDCAADWADCRSGAMWEIGWRSRLRRVRDPITELGPQALLDAGTASVFNSLHSHLGSVIHGVAGNFLPDWAVSGTFKNGWSSDLRHVFINQTRTNFESAAEAAARAAEGQSTIVH